MESYDTIDLKIQACIDVVWNLQMDLLFAFQAAPSNGLSLLTIFNILIVFGILCGIAILVATRRQAQESQRIEGFEFMHEAAPLPLFESTESYYLF